MSAAPFGYNATDAARERSAEIITILDTDYGQVLRTRAVRRDLGKLIAEHDAVIDQRTKVALELANEKLTEAAEKKLRVKLAEVEEQLIDARCAVIALLVGKVNGQKIDHPDPARMADEMDERDVLAIFNGLLGMGGPQDPTQATTPQ